MDDTNLKSGLPDDQITAKQPVEVELTDNSSGDNDLTRDPIEIVNEDGTIITTIDQGQVTTVVGHNHPALMVQESNDVATTTTFPQTIDIDLDVGNKANGNEATDEVLNESQQVQHQINMTNTLATKAIPSLVFSAASATGNGEIVFSHTSTTDSSQELMAVDATISQESMANITLTDATASEEGGEMVFTVVAVDNNMGNLIEMASENLPSEVQLSLMQSSNTNNNQAVMPTGRLSDIARIAVESEEEQPQTLPPTMPSRKMSRNKHDQEEVVRNDKGRVLCDICDQDFSDVPSMRRHRMIHFDAKPFQCEFCDKSFRRKDNLREHRNIHTQEHMYKCDRCGKVFPRKYTHKVHMARHCGKDEQTAQQGVDTWSGGENPSPTTKTTKSSPVTKSSEPCKICLKTFRDASTLKRHLLTHSDERPYKCKECDKAFRRKDHLNEHVVVHKMVRPFSCKTCGKSFSRKNGLKTHMIRTSHLLGYNDVITANDGQEGTAGDGVEQVIAADQLVTVSLQHADGSVPTSAGVEPLVNDTAYHQASDEPTDEMNCSVTCQRSEENVVVSGSMSEDPSRSETFDENNFPEHQPPSSDEVHLPENVMESVEALTEHPKNCDEEQQETTLEEGTVDVHLNVVEAADDDPANVCTTAAAVTADKRKRKRTGGYDRAEQTCSVCNKVFRDATSLKRHALVHSDERPHKCDHCDKRFRRRDHLKSHEISHHNGVTSHDCITCEATFNTRYALTVHVKSCKNRSLSPPKESTADEVKVTGNPESKECPVCHKVFKDPSTQRRHFRIHSDERPFRCEICSKSFRRKDNLREHLLCHSDEKPFMCNDCGKSLSRRSSLANHMNVCPARKVSQASTLANENAIMHGLEFTDSAVCVSGDPREISSAHLLAAGLTTAVVAPSDMTSMDVTSSSTMEPLEEDIEQGIRDDEGGEGGGNPYTCEECGKVFRAKWTLKFHQRVHTGEKPHTCSTCQRHFRQVSHLKVHERTHTGERPFVCQICGRGFIDSSTMKRHERLHKDAADPNAVIIDGDDVMVDNEVIRGGRNDDVDHGNDISHDENVVIDASELRETLDEAEIVQEGVEVSVGDEGAAIQLLVTTANELAAAESSEPVSTSVVIGLNESGTSLDESNLGQILRECIRNQEAVEKIQTLEDWQQNHANETVDQLIYIQSETRTDNE